MTTTTSTTGLLDQARAAYDQLGALLADIGAGFDDVVRVTEHVHADAVASLVELAELREAVLDVDGVAATTVVVHGLPTPGRLVEVELTVAVGDRSYLVTTQTAGPVPAGPAGDLVHLSSVLPLDARGEVVAPGDLVRQTAKVYANAAVQLADLGLGLEDVVKTVEFVPPHVRADYPRSGRIRKAHLAPPYGGATGIVMDTLAHPDALIQVDMFATRHRDRVEVDCGWERYLKLTYNPGLRVGDTFVMSGQGALDVITEEAVLAGDVVAQAEYTYRNILTVLEHAGLGPDALVRSVEYVTPEGLDRYDEVEALRAELFPGVDVAVTSVVCSALLRPEFMIEIDPMAVFPSAAAST